MQSSSFNANISGPTSFNANIEGPRFDANKSVFENRRADNIRIDDGPPPPNFGVNIENNMNSPSFNVNAPNINTHHNF